MGKFGWSYPAGCDGPPDNDRAISPLVEAVLVKLEEAGVPAEVNDRIVKLIEDWEYHRGHEEPGPHWQVDRSGVGGG